MTVTAQNATVSWAAQPTRVGSGTFNMASYTWHRHRAATAQMGIVQGQQMMDLELGGLIVPDGAFKDSMYFVAQMGMTPRLAGSFGWLLHAALGNVSSVANQPVSGMTTHIFRFNPTNTSFIPWVATRVETPTATGFYGEAGFDCKIANMRFVVPNMGKCAAQVGLVGRRGVIDNNPNWTYSNTFEDSNSTPDAGRGTFSIGGTSYPALGVDVMFNNNITTPRQEMIVGSYHPDDFVPLSRDLSFRFVYKYDNPDLHRLLLTGQQAGTTWTPQAYEVSTSGGNYAVDLYVQSPRNATGSQPWGLRIRCNRAVVAEAGPPQLAGGTMIAQEYMISAVAPSSGDYMQILLENTVANYTWPT